MEFDVNYYARLARIKLTEADEKKFERELKDILGYVEELKGVDTKDVTPMTGGTDLRNVYREDEYDPKREDNHKGPANFPEEKEGFLRVPNVFSIDGGPVPK